VQFFISKIILMSAVVFDLAIIGAGASGLQLLYEMIQADTSGEKKILLVDSGDRSQKSWCFWEDEKRACYPFLIEKSWNSMTYRTSEGGAIKSTITPLEYNYISSERFFAYFFEEFIPANPNITLVKNWAKEVEEGDDAQTIRCQDGSTFFARRVADSRPIKSDDPSLIYQHFSGKFIEFDEPILDDSAMTLMDFSLPVSTTEMAVFHYILPFSKTKALIETTVFTKLAYDKEAYELIWHKYLAVHFKDKKFKVLSDEMGTIPMGVRSSPTEGKIFTIGAAGGNMKASTGYAFTRMHEDAKYRAQNQLKVTPNRFRFYDKMLLKIMNNDMAKIPQVMDRLFSRVSSNRILRFLDDKSSLLEDIRLLSKLDIPLFISHLLR
jgi:lycopene beta-cyclase